MSYGFFYVRFLERLTFYFMKTATITMHGKMALSAYTKYYTLRCLEYICSVSSPLWHHGFSLRSRP